MNDQDKLIRLHIAGATIRHTHPFDELPDHKNSKELSASFLQDWVTPYYLEINLKNDQSWIVALEKIKGKITREITKELLGDFNWRTRLVGAYFAAIKGYTEFIDIIGIHLLKSEVCCVGHIYALTLTYFNTEKSIGYLHQYLDHYLTTPSLYFDQQTVMEALLYLDQQQQTNHFAKHVPAWEKLSLERARINKKSVSGITRMLEIVTGKSLGEEKAETAAPKEAIFKTDFFTGHMAILERLKD